MKTKLSVLAIAVLATFSSATYAESFALSSGSHESDDDVTYESSTYAPPSQETRLLPLMGIFLLHLCPLIQAVGMRLFLLMEETAEQSLY